MRLCYEFRVEYKGEAYKTNDDSREKKAIGELWAMNSAGRCLFLMAVKEDETGQSTAVQVDRIIGFDAEWRGVACFTLRHLWPDAAQGYIRV